MLVGQDQLNEPNLIRDKASSLTRDFSFIQNLLKSRYNSITYLKFSYTAPDDNTLIWAIQRMIISAQYHSLWIYLLINLTYHSVTRYLFMC
jgi:hypothetical protein